MTDAYKKISSEVVEGIKGPLTDIVIKTVNGKIDKIDRKVEDMRKESQDFHEARVQQSSALDSNVNALGIKLDKYIEKDNARWERLEEWKETAQPLVSGAIGLQSSWKIIVGFLAGLAIIITSVVTIVNFIKK